MKVEGYFPLEPGLRWVYERYGSDEVEEIAEVEERDGETRVRAYRGGGEKGSGRTLLLYSVKDGGVSLVRDGQSAYEQPVPFMQVSLRSGATWESVKPAVAGSPLGWGGTMTVGDAEEVKVPAGTFTAIPVTYTVTKLNGKPLDEPRVSTRWYAKGVGLVRESNGKDEVRVLKSFTKDAKK